MHANSQTFTISGKVVDENKQSLISASVLIKSLKKGTSTDIDGNYQLNCIKWQLQSRSSFYWVCIGY